MARLHCDPLRNAKRLRQETATDPDQTPSHAEKPQPTTLNYQPGCIKVVDTFR